MWLGYRALSRRPSPFPVRLWVGAGILLGIGTLTKIPVIFDTAALMMCLIGWNFRNRTFNGRYLARAGTWLGIGILLPWLIALAIFLLQQTAGDFIRYAILYNFKYVGDWSSVAYSPLLNFLAPWPVRIGLLVVPLILIWGLPEFRLTGRIRFLMTWFWLGLFGVLLSLRPYPHYFFQVLPVMSLLVGAMVKKEWNYRIAGLVAIGLMFALIRFLPVHLYRTAGYGQNLIRWITGKTSYEHYTAWFNDQAVEDLRLAYWINTHTQRTARIFVWGNRPAIYTLSRLQPAAPFLTDYHVLSFNVFDRVYAHLDARAETVVVDCRRNPDSFPLLYGRLLHRSPQFATGTCDVYLPLATATSGQ